MVEHIRQAISEEEANSVREFLALPLELQGQLWSLLSKRTKLIVGVIECISDGPKTYEEIAEMLDWHPGTFAGYCYTIFGKQSYLLVKKGSVLNETSGKRRRTWGLEEPIRRVS